MRSSSTNSVWVEAADLPADAEPVADDSGSRKAIVVKQRWTCNDKTYACMNGGEKHGSYTYRYVRNGGELHSEYVGKA